MVSSLAQLQESCCDSQRAGEGDRPEGQVLACPSEGLIAPGPPLLRPLAVVPTQPPNA